MGDVWDLLGRRRFRRLVAVRVATQLADGTFEAALAILFFFDPQHAKGPAGIAAAFAVLTVPFTLVGPWAGVPLDRWSRRNTLVMGSAARAALAVVAALLLAVDNIGLGLYVVVLIVVSINRFLLSAISAGLPRLVPAEDLVLANAVTPTLGTVGSAIGAAVAYAAIGGGARPQAVVVAVAVIQAVTTGLALRLRRGELGPEPAEATAARAVRHPVRLFTRDMAMGLRYLGARRAPRAALSAMTAHRFLFGAATLSTVLLARSPRWGMGNGLSGSALVLTGAGAGLLVAAVSTPAWTRHREPATVGATALAAMGAAAGVLSLTLSPWLVLTVAATMGWGGQSLKICVDTIVQHDVEDSYRGRVFSVYDVLFNAAFLVSMAALAPVIPSDGYSRALFALLFLGYLAAATLYWRASNRNRAAR